MEDNLRSLRKNTENWSEEICKRFLGFWRHGLVSSNNSPNEKKLISYIWLSWRSLSNGYGCLLAFDSKTNESSLWNKIKHSFYDGITQLPKLWSSSKSHLYYQIKFLISQENKYLVDYMAKRFYKPPLSKREVWFFWSSSLVYGQ